MGTTPGRARFPAEASDQPASAADAGERVRPAAWCRRCRPSSPVVLGALLELGLGLAQGASQLRQLGPAEDEEDDEEDDEQFGCTEVHRASVPVVQARRSCGRSHGDGDVLECIVNVSEGRDAAVLDALRRRRRRRPARPPRRPPPPPQRAHHRRRGGGPPDRQGRRRPHRPARPRRRPPPARCGRRRALRRPRRDPSPCRRRAGPGRLRRLGRRRAGRCPPSATAATARPCPRSGGGPSPAWPRRRARRPHPTAGAVAVGCRPPLVAYNVWLAEPDLAVARRVAAEVRGDGIRALGLAVGDRVQVSMNLVEPERVGPGGGLRPGGGPGARRRRRAGRAAPRGRPGRGGARTLGGAGPGRRTGRSRPAWPPSAGAQAVWMATAAASRAMARWRRMRRRSRSLMPPQMPNFSPLVRAYSRHSSRTTQPRQTSLASRWTRRARGRRGRGRRPGSWRTPATSGPRCRRRSISSLCLLVGAPPVASPSSPVPRSGGRIHPSGTPV